ncbi:MAG: DUF427 domain-containing protein [Chloroflexi bacterium]|nr:DUF427 domain-containing protein [Chloroflexota bacterium]MCH8234611.1 DUF427 domain-containing protein [Chloroflexota bacterium]MCH8817644.1 DUF427 domain-containing protein [Chloroflexota bacterium]
MARASYNGHTLAESSDYEVVEGNVYFPPESIDREVFTDSSLQTVCPWKGVASYLNLVIEGQELRDVAWYYPEPKSDASHIKDYVAFYPQITVES